MEDIKERSSRQGSFQEQITREIGRCREYGHRATFMLMEPMSQNGEFPKGYETKLFKNIKDELRGVDQVFPFGEGLFAIILPDTHEGGGESAAVRLKRSLSERAEASGMKLAWSVGIMSIGPDFTGDEKTVLAELEKDLARDRICQSLIQPGSSGAIQPGQDTFRCILIDSGWPGLDDFMKASSYTFKTTVIDREDVEYDFPSILAQAAGSCAIVVTPVDSDIELSSILKILRKYQRFSFIPAVLLDAQQRQFCEIQMVLDPDISPKALASIVSGLFSTIASSMSATGLQKYCDVLSSISAATHQLNQPLQIIAGKMELALMDLESCSGESGPDSATRLMETLREVRDQALHAANINSKINRLTKI